MKKQRRGLNRYNVLQRLKFVLSYFRHIQGIFVKVFHRLDIENSHYQPDINLTIMCSIDVCSICLFARFLISIMALSKRVFHYMFSFETKLCTSTLCHHESQIWHEPRRQKTGLRGFRPGPTQTGLYSHRRWLEAWNFGFRKGGIVLSV